MGFLSWVIFGLSVGIITNYLDKNNNNEPKLFSNLLMGVLGSISGGFLSSLVFGADFTQFSMIPLLAAGISAVLLLFVGQSLKET